MKARTIIYLLFTLLLAASFDLNAKPFDWIEIRVNGHIITHNEIELKTFETAQARKITQKEAFLALRDEVVEKLIDEALLDSKAEELGITLSDDELNDEVDYFRKQRKLGPTEFEELLEAKKTNLAEFKRSYAKQIIRNKVIGQEVKALIRISDDELRKQYDTAARTYSKIKARHILRRLPPNASSKQVEEVRKKIVWIREQIKNGKSFTEMADTYSEDPSVTSNHGELGFFKKEDMVSEFSNAAFSLPLHTISAPVKSVFGYHLIEVTDTQKETKAPFDTVKGKLYQKAFQKVFPVQLKAYLKKLRSNVNITKK